MSAILDVNRRDFVPVTTVRDVDAVCRLYPLEPGSPALVDLTLARGDDALHRLSRRLLPILMREHQRAKLVFGSQIGTGKSTLLRRALADLEQAGDVTTVRLDIDKKTRDTVDYTLLMLWMASQTAKWFADHDMPLDGGVVADVASWFADRTLERETRERVEASIKTQAKAGIGWFGLSFLGQVSTGAIASQQNAELLQIKANLLRDPDALVGQMNLLFRHARQVLKRHGKPDRLLLAVDNLEKVPQDNTPPIFEAGQDPIMALDVDLLLTGPPAIGPSLKSMRNWPGGYVQMPAPRVRGEDGAPFQAGLDALFTVVTKRADSSVFASDAVIQTAIEQSDGDLRLLMRLIAEAAINALVEEAEHIRAEDLERALKEEGHGLYRALANESHRAYPMLAAIDRTGKRPPTPDEAGRELFAHLLEAKLIAEHENGEVWYTVTPLARRIDMFRKARDAAPPATPSDGG